MILKKMFSRGWLFTTLLVLAGTAVCARLGIWQLDRLETRRADNAQYIEMQSVNRLDLNVEIPGSFDGMKDRAVAVIGEYDFANQVAVRNQVHGDQYGYHLFTPLQFDGTAVFPPTGTTRRKTGASTTSPARSTSRGGFSRGMASQPSAESPTRFRRMVPRSNFGSTPTWQISPVNCRIRSCRCTSSRRQIHPILRRRSRRRSLKKI
jgi:hypothetical protein